MVNTQSMISRKSELAIIPPTVQPAFAVMEPECIDQSPGTEFLERSAGPWVKQHRAFPSGGVVYVSRLRRDVEISAQG
jgi:hypothetical protein